MNKNIMKAFGFNKEVKSYENGTCPICHKKVSVIDLIEKERDTGSPYVKEYTISGLCVKCQDSIFE